MNTLYFPETTLSATPAVGLLFFFDTIRMLEVVEQDKASPLEPFNEKGFLSGYCPAPLGDDRERFLQLIGDIQGHEAEYLSGVLSSLSTNPGLDADEQTVWDLVSRLSRGQLDPDARNRDMARKNLWRARLVLKLYEFFQAEESEISAGWENIRQSEAQMLKLLKGELDDDEDEQDMAAVFRSLTDVNLPELEIRIEHLLKAWGTLYLQNETDDIYVFTTPSEQSKEVVFEEYYEIKEKRPQPLMELRLPQGPGSEPGTLDAWFSRRKAFRQQMEEEIRGAQTLLGDIACGRTAGNYAQQLAVFAENWNDCDVEWETGWQVRFYLLESVSFREIAARICNPRKSIDRDDQKTRHGVVAVLEKI